MKNETLIKKTTSSKSGAINGILPGHNLKTNHYLLIVIFPAESQEEFPTVSWVIYSLL